MTFDQEFKEKVKEIAKEELPEELWYLALEQGYIEHFEKYSLRIYQMGQEG